MKLKNIFAGVSMLLAVAGANAGIITFTGLNQTYGDGNALGANMTATATQLSYTEGGFLFTLMTPNTYNFGAHIGDAGVANTFNWHDSVDNGAGAYVVITKVGGGLFNLVNFDYAVSGNLTVSAAGNVDRSLSGSGVANLNFLGVSSVKFSSNNTTLNQLDNVNLRAVPEPVSLALFGAGLALLGVARRRKA